MNSMNRAEQVREFVISSFLFGDGALLKDDQSFLESGIVDSTGMLELIMFLEGTYGVKIESEEMVPENLDSINRVVQFLTKKASKVAGGL
jgi:acyl carrier protein